MIKKEYLDTLGITRFHKAGYTGKHVKIMSDEKILEETPEGVSSDVWKSIISPEGFRKTTGKDPWHGTSVMQHLLTIAPDATMICYPFTGKFGSKGYESECADYILENGVHIFTAPNVSTVVNEDKEKLLRKCLNSGCLFFTSTGNVDDDISSNYIVVGKAKEGYEEYERLDYLTIPSFRRTYCSAIFSAQCALVQDFFISKTGRPLDRFEMSVFIANHLREITLPSIADGTLHTYEIFVLPNPRGIIVSNYISGYIETDCTTTVFAKVKSKNYYIEGKKIECPAPIKRWGKPYIPLSVLEELGMSVIWDAKRGEIRIDTN